MKNNYKIFKIDLFINKYEMAENIGLKDIDVFEKLKKKLIVNNPNKYTDLYKKRKNELIECLEKNKDIAKCLEKKIDIRIIFDLISDEDYNIIISEDLLSRFKKLKPNSGLSDLKSTTELFFKKFRFLGKIQFNLLIEFIYWQFNTVKSINSDISLKKLYGKKEHIFSLDSPKFIINESKNKNLNFSQILLELSIPINHDYDYYQACQNLYFIDAIKALPLGANNKIFTEILDNEIKTRKYNNEYNLGQYIIKLLIDKVIKSKKKCPKNWLDFIISVAGDPRVPKTHINYINWWFALKNYIPYMKQWLASSDLGLFLEILEEEGKRHGNDSFLRMFPARKTFLKGLDNQNLIIDAKLFLSNNAYDYINEYTNKAYNLKKSMHNDITVIYLNLEKAHIIEGSHDFAVRIYDVLPEKSKLNSDSYRELSIEYLRKEIEKIYKKYNPNSEYPIRFRHTPTNTWQNKLVNELMKLGVNISLDQVVTRETYKSIIKKFGI